MGKTTYRIFLDGAWRNVEGQVSWKNHLLTAFQYWFLAFLSRLIPPPARLLPGR
jgi:hypothetical protein